MEIFGSSFNPDSMFDNALPSLKINLEAKQPAKKGEKNKLKDILDEIEEEDSLQRSLSFNDSKVIKEMPEETMREIN